MSDKPRRLQQLIDAGFSDDTIAHWLAVERWRLKAAGLDDCEIHSLLIGDIPASSSEGDE